MPTYSFDEDFIRSLGSLDEVKKWSNGRHDESALIEVWDKVKPAEPAKTKTKKLNTDEGQE